MGSGYHATTPRLPAVHPSHAVKSVALGLAAALLWASCASAPARAPEIRADAWLNGPPPGDLRGSLVLVEFWTFG